MYLERVVISNKKNPTLTRRGIPPLLTRKETKNMLFNVMRIAEPTTAAKIQIKNNVRKDSSTIITHTNLYGKHFNTFMKIFLAGSK